ncbi:sulfotransferase [Nocardioides sp. YIM 152315]|uniref:sulfotransferase n=1 Tax=Nocardioides sp. YIM 152315 TaxID=3031760 RepID=UPI0023DAFFAD|nr:sulfotransferase [Nocardioides sp. YIM 152315]MDF1602452.1 sulfotransferase [Nocardioides sp. YIM 152315]
MRAPRGLRARGELARLRQENAALRRRVAALEGRDDLRYLFVMTYGRSGSTLLQGVLNAIPGYLIRGENRQMMRQLYDYHRTGAEARRVQRKVMRRLTGTNTPTDPTRPFFGMDGYPTRRSLAGFRRLALETILRPEQDTRVVGFKEIRWAREDAGEFVAWLREVFPGARFVVNTRNHDDVAKSLWWAEDPTALERLKRAEGRLLALAAELGDAAYHVRYDDYVADPAALEPFFTWLGEPFDEQRVREVLAVRHSR